MTVRQGDLSRILTLVPVVARQPGITVQELARRFDCSPSEIRKDLSRVLLCGVPPYLPSDFVLVDFEGDRVFMDFADHFARPVNLLVEEALALELALDALSGMGESEVVSALAAKVGGLLCRRDAGAAEATDRIDVAVQDRRGARLQVLLQALTERRPVEIDYYTATRDEMSTRTIEPLRLEEEDGLLYVKAHCHRRREERTFRVDRMRAVRLLPGARVAPDPRAAERGPEMEVVVAFDPGVARFVEERFGDRLERGNPGEAVRLRLRTEHADWIFAWLLTFGGSAEILSPPEVRRAYLRRLDAIIARHA